MSVNTIIYDDRFFKSTILLEKASAEPVVTILMKYFKPQSVIDIGCGVGLYLKEFNNKGVKILGYDGSPAAIKNSLVGAKIKLHDLTKPLKLNKRFDLCLCIEVAEHLEKRYSDRLAKTLTNLSNIIIFTAATPGQGPISIGHINEQPSGFWKKKFKKYFYFLDKNLTKKIRRDLKRQKVIWWVVKNLMVFRINNKKI